MNTFSKVLMVFAVNVVIAVVLALAIVVNGESYVVLHVNPASNERVNVLMNNQAQFTVFTGVEKARVNINGIVHDVSSAGGVEVFFGCRVYWDAHHKEAVRVTVWFEQSLDCRQVATFDPNHRWSSSFFRW